MIWATVSSQSCFCWLYRTSPSSAAKNIINLILVLTIWWCPCVESSLVLLKVFAMISVVSLHNSISLLPCFLVYSKVKLACFLLDFMLNLDCHKYFLKSLHQFFVYSWKHKEQFYFFIFRFYFSVKSPDLGMCIYLEILLCSPWKVKQKKCTL